MIERTFRVSLEKGRGKKKEHLLLQLTEKNLQIQSGPVNLDFPLQNGDLEMIYQEMGRLLHPNSQNPSPLPLPAPNVPITAAPKLKSKPRGLVKASGDDVKQGEIPAGVSAPNLAGLHKVIG